MIWCLSICVILSVIIILLIFKIDFMEKAVGEICTEFSDILESDTNNLVCISCHDKSVRNLANNINMQLKILRKQRFQFVQGDMELKTAITNISHDLRTPLTAISCYLDLLDTVDKSTEAERYIEIIKNRTDALKQLSEELFRYSVITSPDYDTTTEPVMVNRILEESIAGFYAELKQKKIIPDICITDVKIVRMLNHAALSRIFSNLINNAVKYSDGDLKITLTDTGKIVFSNSASDLTQVQVERLFDRFYTVENARKSTGLGLSIARILIEQMNGTISAEYKKGRLIISIQLPDS